MRVLQSVEVTPEQLQIVVRNRPGVMLIRGAAGSGKTTTALLRLRTLIAAWLNRHRSLGLTIPVNVLVLTYNKTLKGYISELVERQIEYPDGVSVFVDTFGHWSRDVLGEPSIVNDKARRNIISSMSGNLNIDQNFLLDEVEYVLGRFLPETLDDYIGARRDGRGNTPRVEADLRRRILSDVIHPYNIWKAEQGLKDWNDLAVDVSRSRIGSGYDIIVADESQDFSANQVRAIYQQQADTCSLTFILDAIQRIYPRGFTWREAGVTVRPENTFRLGQNYRNTSEIALFAAGIVEGMAVEDDGTIPDHRNCMRHGPVPKVLQGLFSDQASYAINYIKSEVNLREESVAFLHPKGEGCFDYLRLALRRANLSFVELTRQAEWPQGVANIGLSTLHSAKGLEFDHVFILGLNQEFTPHGDDEGDDRLEVSRRLVAMGAGRARNTLHLGYKATEMSSVVRFFRPGTFEDIVL